MSTLYVNNISPQSGSEITMTNTLVMPTLPEKISFESGAEVWGTITALSQSEGQGLLIGGNDIVTLTGSMVAVDAQLIPYQDINMNNWGLQKVAGITGLNTTGSIGITGSVEISGSLTLNGDSITAGGGGGGDSTQDFTGVDPYGFTSNGDMSGDIIKIGSTTTVLSNLCYLTDSSVWTLADASDVTASGPVLLGLAVGTNSGTDGMLTRGYARISAALLAGTAITKQGDPVYVSTTAGALTFTAPSASGDTVRIVGYLASPVDTNTDSVVLFNPDSTYVEIIQETDY